MGQQETSPALLLALSQLGYSQQRRDEGLIPRYSIATLKLSAMRSLCDMFCETQCATGPLLFLHISELSKLRAARARACLDDPLP